MYKDINGYPVTLSKFITDNDLLVIPPVTSQIVMTAQVSFPDAFPEGEDESFFRIPFIDVTNNGVIIVGADVRYHSTTDFTKAHTGIKRSLNGGLTWESDQIIHESNLVDEDSRKHNASILIDRNTNRVFIFAYVIDSYTGNPTPVGSVLDPPPIWDFVYKYSDDDGATWSEEISLKLVVQDPLSNIVVPGTSTIGLTLSNGMLVLSIYDGRQNDNFNIAGDDWFMRSGLIYSADHGATWTKSTLISRYTNESSIVEHDGGIVLIARGLNGGRTLWYTNDLGNTWSYYYGNLFISSFVCQIGMLKYVSGSKWRGLVSTPVSATDRSSGHIYITKYWRKFKKFILFEPEIFEGYTCMAQYGTHLYLVTEKGGNILFYDFSSYSQYLT